MQGRWSSHHQFVLGELLEELVFLDARIIRLESEMEGRLRVQADVLERFCTIPGIDRITAWSLIAELGLAMAQFPDAAHLASGAGLCPGNCESAGQRRTGKTRQGNIYLRRRLCQAA